MSDEHNRSHDDKAADAWLELQLQEELGELQPPDLRHRVLASTSERRARAAQAVTARSHSTRWLTAAMVLIGIATVIGVIQFANKEAKPINSHLQDPKPAPKSGQAPQELLAKSLKQFQQHAATATGISIEAGLLGLPNSVKCLRYVDAAVASSMLTELQTLKQLPPAGWKWSNSIYLDLPDGRFMTCAVYQTDKHRLGIRGLGDFEMTERLRALLAPLIEATALKTRLVNGIVTSPEDLLPGRPEPIPPDIERLTCHNLADKDLALFARFKKLQTLDLSGCAKTIRGEGLSNLLLLTNLETLKLRYTKVADKHLATVGMHGALRHLDVSSHEQLTGTFLTTFSATNKLQSLMIGWGKTLTDEGPIVLSKVDSLTHLDLSGRHANELTTVGLSQFANMKALQHLNVNNMPVPMDKVMGYLGGLPDLHELHATFTNLSNSGLMMLRASHANKTRGTSIPLRSLDLTGCKELKDGTLKQLGNFVNLEHLNLSRTSLRNGTDSFQDLQSLNKLTKLELNGLRLNSNDCLHLARLPSLNHLDLSFNGGGIDDDALQHLATATHLTHLLLTGCDNFTDAGLITLGQLASLKHLDLNTCDGFTIDGLESFRALRPDCELRLPDRFR